MRLIKGIDGIKFVKPEATFFLYTDFSKYGDDWDLSLRLLENGVMTVPSIGPSAGFGSNGEGYIRLSYALEDQAIMAGVSRVK